MDNLVELKRDEVFCDSQMVARKFDQKHNKVVAIINNLQTGLEELRGITTTPKVIKEEREYRGLKYTAHLMNREFFSLLVMRFRGKKALEWQVKFNAAFYEMEKRLLIEITNKNNESWIATRQQGRLVRKETTDIVKEFVEYATNQGSIHAKMYYKHITNLTYKALGLLVQRNPKIRDTIEIINLCYIAMAETEVQRLLKIHMEDKIPYKKIYDFLKEDLERFAESLTMGSLGKRIR